MRIAHLFWPVVLLIPVAGSAQNITINDDKGPLERCDQLEISFDQSPALRDEETLSVPVGTGPVTVELVEHGGVALRNGAGPDHEITLCKAVPDDQEAALAEIRASVDGNSVHVTGPAGHRWVGYLLMRSPRGSRVHLSAMNGPIRVDSFDGELTAKAVNGPIGLSRPRGTVTARAENGPIKLEGDGGNVTVETQNGPISVRLAGSQWQAGTLVAHAQNGPLSVDVPPQYRSSVEIESKGHAPWSCRGNCPTEDDGVTRRARLGDGPVNVKLSTENGPVSVR